MPRPTVRPTVRVENGAVLSAPRDDTADQTRGDTGYTRLLFPVDVPGPLRRKPEPPADTLQDLLGEAFKGLRGRWPRVAYSYAFAASAERVHPGGPPADFDDTRNRYFYAWVPFDVSLADFVPALAALSGVRSAELSADPPVTIWEPQAAPDPDAAAEAFDAFSQPWAGPEGINAVEAWAYAGARGDGITIADLEQGWTLDHIDLYDTGNPDRIRRVYGLNQAYMGHGTAVLGILAARDDGKGCTGAVPAARIRCYSLIEDSGWDLPLQWAIDAVAWGVNPLIALQGEAPGTGGGPQAEGIHPLAAGDILLIEDQGSLPALDVTGAPAEVQFPVFVAIRDATNRGITVIEPAGNGGVDLDWLVSQPGVAGLGNGVRDSGAILVGASTAGDPRERTESSCFGARINCHAWGEAVFTTGDGWEGNDRFCYTLFGGTSAASAQVAAVAAAVQGAHSKSAGAPLAPADLRQALVASGRPSGNPATDLIGVMPDAYASIRAFAGEPPGNPPAYPDPADNDLSDVVLCGVEYDEFDDPAPALAPVFFVLGLLTGVVLMLIQGA